MKRCRSLSKWKRAARARSSSLRMSAAAASLPSTSRSTRQRCASWTPRGGGVGGTTQSMLSLREPEPGAGLGERGTLAIGREHRLGHLARLGGAPLIGRERFAVAVDATHRGLEALRLGAHAHVLQHEGGREYGGGGIGDALARDVRRRAVHRFEVGPAVVAEIAGGRQPQAARRLRPQVRQDVAVEIHAQDDVHGPGEAHEPPRGVVDVEVLELETGLAHDALGGLLIEPVRARKHVRLGDAGDLAGLAPGPALPGEVTGEAGDALRALGGDDLHREAPLVTEFLDLAPRPVAQIGHDVDQIGQLALAAWIESLAVLAQEDVVEI